MPETFTETTRNQLRQLAKAMEYYLQNKLNFAFRTPLTGENVDAFQISSLAHPNDKLIYGELNQQPLNLNVKDGGTF